jgi:PTH1 family peptidyl-tRNA hydrolase
MSLERIRLIVGLGNPGDKYAKTRHNLGFMVVDEIADTYSIPLDKQKFDALFGRGSINGNPVILAKPMAFMNRSGPPTQKLAQYFNILCGDMLVIHDDIDLTYGRIKIKEKGGHGGHNGIRSLIDAFGSGDFVRIRIGIGRPDARIHVVDHVLGRFSADETKRLNPIITRARDATVTILRNGLKQGMNQFNSN